MNKAPSTKQLPIASLGRYDDVLLDLYGAACCPKRLHGFLYGFANLLQAEAAVLVTPGWSQEEGGIWLLVILKSGYSPLARQAPCAALWSDAVNRHGCTDTVSDAVTAWSSEELGLPVESLTMRDFFLNHLSPLNVCYAVGAQGASPELEAGFQLGAFRSKARRPFGRSEKLLTAGLARHVKLALVQLGRRRHDHVRLMHFGLTPAERRLVSLLLAGKTLREAATLKGVKYSTVRSQLNSVFQKVGVHRQADLIARLR